MKPVLKINPDRIDLDEAYMQMAEIWAKRSKANRLQVGALIVHGDKIISDGYNGMPAGMQGQDEVCEEYVMPDDYDGRDGIGGPPDPEIRTKQMVLHAEANAILKLARDGSLGAEGATLYVTYSPCPECAKLIRQARIARVVFRKHYRLPQGVEMLQKLGVECDQLKTPGTHGEVEVADPDEGTPPFLQKLWPSEALANVLFGEPFGQPITRMECTKQVWEYIKAYQLQDSVQKRIINCDDALFEVFGKWKVDIFELTALIGKHLFTDESVTPKKKPDKRKV